jgi:Putative peptidoglycan binding domain
VGKRPGRNNHQVRVDDWLAEQGDLDWFDDPSHGEAAAAGSSQMERPDSGYRSGNPGGIEPGSRPLGQAPAGRETIVRRRRILTFLALALLVVTGIAVAIATSGGEDSRGSPATVGSAPQNASEPPTTRPGPTTTQATRPPTTPAQTQPTPPSASLKVALPADGKLGIGDSGSAVVTLQKMLAALKLEVGTPDGNFGPRTEAAVIAFQTTHALDPDGIVGPATAQKLNERLASAGA